MNPLPSARLVALILAAALDSRIAAAVGDEKRAEAPPPKEIQALLDTFAKAQARLDEEYQRKLAAEREKLYNLLDKAKTDAAHRGDADAIVAIKLQMDKLVAEANHEDEQSANAKTVAALRGTWNVTSNNGWRGTLIIDGEGKATNGRAQGQVEIAADKVTFYWNETKSLWYSFNLPIVDGKAGGDSWDRGKDSITAVKISTK